MAKKKKATITMTSSSRWTTKQGRLHLVTASWHLMLLLLVLTMIHHSHASPSSEQQRRERGIRHHHQRQLWASSSSSSSSSNIKSRVTTTTSSNKAAPKGSSTSCSHDFDFSFQRQVILTFQGRPGLLVASSSSSSIALLQKSVLLAYNQAVNCGYNGGPYDPFLWLTQVVITTDAIDAILGTAATANATQQFNLYATWTGQCRGCETTPFSVLQVNVPISDRQRRQRKRRKRRRTNLQQGNFLHPQHEDETGQSLQQQQQHVQLQPERRSLIQQPPSALPPCICSVPLESTFLAYFNNHFVPLYFSSSIDSMVSVVPLEQVSCSSTITTFDTYLSLQFGAGPDATNTAALATQAPYVSQATTQTYNDANTNSLTNCDVNFVTVSSSSAQVIVPLGSDNSNRRRRLTTTHKNTTTTTTTSKTSTAKLTTVVKVPATCRGCSSSVSLFNDASGRRRRRRIQHDGSSFQMQPEGGSVVSDYDLGPYDINGIHRQLPVISGNCYCPINPNTSAITIIGRTSTQQYLQVFNDKLQDLGPQGDGLITVVSSALDSVQVEPVNCTSNVTDLDVTVTLALNGTTVSIDGQDYLQQAFHDTYNGLAQHYCDPYYRRVELAQVVGVGNRRLARESMTTTVNIQERSLKTVSVTVTVKGTCRGCPSSTPLLNDASGRRHLGQQEEEEEVEAGFITTSSDMQTSWDDEATNMDHRLLQSGALCFCPVDPIADRAPDTSEFLVAYNDALYPDYYVLGLVETSTTLAPSLSPTASPTAKVIPATKKPTKKPSRAPHPKRAKKPTRYPTTMPTAGPTHVPTKRPTWKPTVAPTEQPTSLISAAPLPLPTAFPTQKRTATPNQSPTTTPTRQPTQPPTEQPTNPPTPGPTGEPTTPPTDPPTAGPTRKLTIPPTTTPTNYPSPGPTRKPAPPSTTTPTATPTIPPSGGPTRTPAPPPTAPPTAEPTASPTAGPTRTPTTPPTTSPTANPTASPTAAPTRIPTPPPTPSPTPLPTTTPTAGPTRIPTSSPSTPPTELPSASPTAGPSRNPTPLPTAPPSPLPTLPPTVSPTAQPTASPTAGPTLGPTPSPTAKPTNSPTTHPTRQPTTAPTKRPTPHPTKRQPHYPTWYHD